MSTFHICRWRLALAPCLCAFTIESSPVTLDWTARFSSQGSVGVPSFLGLDEMGHARIAGISSDGTGAIALKVIQYGEDGEEVWVASTGEGFDYVTGFAVDAAGNSHVAGRSFHGTPGVVIVKSDRHGTGVWTNRLVEAQSDARVAVDSGGNVLVLTATSIDWLSLEMLLVKYSSDGRELWRATPAGTGLVLATDPDGNVLVAGFERSDGEEGPPGLQIMIVQKFHSHGGVAWRARIPESQSGTQMVVDGAGRVFAAGESQDTVVTAAFGAEGGRLWLAALDVTNQEDWPTGLELDSEGNLYVAAVGDARDTVLAKYDPQGRELWVARDPLGGDAGDIRLAVGSDGVYLSGGYVSFRALELDSDIVARKFDGNGSLIWTTRLEELGEDVLWTGGIAVDAHDRIYITFAALTGSDFDELVTVRYSQTEIAGHPVILHPPPSLTVVEGETVRLEIVVQGAEPLDYQWFKNGEPIPGGTQRVLELSGVSRFDEGHYSVGVSNAIGAVRSPSGFLTVIPGPPPDVEPTEPVLVWSRAATGVGNPVNGSLLAADAAGNLYLAAGTAGDHASDYQLIKWDAQGLLLWRSTHEGPDSRYDEPTGLAVDAQGNAHMTGYATPLNRGRDFLTVKLNGEGEVVWEAMYGSSGNTADLPAAIGVDANGNTYVTGTSDSDGSADLTTIKYSPDGLELWVRTFRRGFRTHAQGMLVDPAGKVFVIAISYGGLNDWTVLNYNTHGDLVWARHYDGAAHYDDQPEAMALDADGNLVVAGTSNDALGFEFLAVKYNPTGGVVWTARHRDNARGYGLANVGLDSGGNVYLLAETVDEESQFIKILKYNDRGERLWQACLAGAWSLGTPMAVGATGSAYLNLIPGATDGNRRLNVVKFDASGSRQWFADYSLEDGWQLPTGLALNPEGDVYASGLTPGEFRLARLTESSAPAKPRIESVPIDQTVVAGAPAEFSVRATGTGPFTYRWRHNGLPLPGATAPTLTFPHALPFDAGCYSVEVSNETGGIETPAAELVVLAPERPHIAAMNHTPDNAFHLTVAVAPGGHYVLECSVDLRHWVTLFSGRNDTGVLYFTDADSSRRPVSFYRVIGMD